MNFTRVDQQKSSSSSIRRSSLVVNLSTTKKRSSVTTLLDSSSSSLSTLGSKSLFSHHRHGNHHQSLFNTRSSNTLPLVSQRSLDAYSYSSNNNTGSNSSRILNHRYCSPYANIVDSASNKTMSHNIYLANSPQSAPPSLDKPSYCTTKTITTTIYNNNADDDNNQNKDKNNKHNIDQTSQTQRLELSSPKEMFTFDNTTNYNNNNNNIKRLQVIINNDNNANSPIKEICKSPGNNNNASRTNSVEEESYSPVPIVEVKNTSSSSNNNSNTSSDCEDSQSSRRLIRKRTVRRYHQRATTTTTEEEEEAKRSVGTKGGPDITNKRTTAELTISINKAPSSTSSTSLQQDNNNLEDKQESGTEVRSHYRTRQIGSYYGQHQQRQEQAKTSSSLASSSTSKIAKCSITTNRKQTTSTISEESSSLKTNKAAVSAAAAAIEVASSKEQKMASSTSSLLNKQTVVNNDNVLKDNNCNSNGSSSTLISTSLPSSRIVRPFEGLLSKDQFKNKDLFDIEPSITKSIQVEEAEESRVHHRESFSSRTSLKRATGGSVMIDGSNLRKAAANAAANAAATAAATAVTSLSASSSATSEASSSSARHLTTMLNGTTTTSDHQDHHESSTLSSSSSSRHYKTSSSSVLLSAAGVTENKLSQSSSRSDNNNFLNSDSLFSSPDVRSLVKEITTDFAELENALSSTTRSLSNSKLSGANQSGHSGISSLSSRLFGRRLLSRIESDHKAISNSSSGHNLYDDQDHYHSNSTTRASSIKLNDNMDGYTNYHQDQASSNKGSEKNYQRSYDNGFCKSNTDKINDLLTKAESFNNLSLSSLTNRSYPGIPTTQKFLVTNENNNDNNIADKSNAKLLTIENNLKQTSETDRPSSLLLSNENKIGVTVSIERIDQKMSDLCKKFNECNDTKEAIDLLKIMIKMVEKAWSVPVCGDDLGFKLCNSLRAAGGLDIILGFIQDAENLSTIAQNEYENDASILNNKAQSNSTSIKQDDNNNNNPLRLNLSNLNQDQSVQSISTSPPVKPPPLTTTTTCDNNNDSIIITTTANNSKNRGAVRDSDSDAITSDLGLDSTSVESLSYVSASASEQALSTKSDDQDKIKSNDNNNKKLDTIEDVVSENHTKQVVKNNQQQQQDDKTIMTVSENETTKTIDHHVNENKNQNKLKLEDLNTNNNQDNINDHLVDEEIAQIIREEDDNGLNEEEANLRKEELVFLSAKLLSQCLTLDNRDYIVENGLNPVIKLACNFTTMKSSQSQKLLSRSMIMRKSSTSIKSKYNQNSEQEQNSVLEKQGEKQTDNNITSGGTIPITCNLVKTTIKSNPSNLFNNNFKIKGQQEQKLLHNNENNNNDSDHNVVHAIIGTEILQHLFKHSEDTCSKMTSLGALQAILYACRSSNIETLRHCASALANLALYGGPDIQQTMIEEQAHHWLFPLAFNEDDNVQYYACLAIVVLAANQEIEADVQKSGTLDLVEPFVTLHEPQKFAESTTAHIHGQSANWLRKLIPLLESKRQEARSLACFHFAMEAYIKKEQGQTRVFHDIGAVEILKKVGCSPIAIISKFSCQALRLIGEKEPHRLSQHVPKWTCEDVIVWVSQIGFGNKYNQAFMNSHVDGDLLLQLDEDMLRLDIGIDNGIIRKKFLRELSKLKQIADYSSVDKSNLSSLLKSHVGSEFVQYIYLMIQLGVTRDNIHWLDIDKLLNECKISNTIHQLKLAQAIKDLQEKMAAQVEADEANELLDGRCLSLLDGNTNLDHHHAHHHQKKTLDVFVSYRRSTGSQLASLLKVHLQLRGFSVFIDVERLEAGKFDNNLLDSIKSAKNFILVLSPNALDRCIGDHDCKDWVHKEIVAALASNCNIIPIMDNFHWPDADQLPEDMRSITYFNGVRWIHDYQDACVDKVERFIRGELMNNYFLTSNNPNSMSLNSTSAPSSLQRTGGGSSSGAYASTATPAIITGGVSGSSTATPSTATFPPITPRIPAPPFDSEHHPLSFASTNNHNNYHHNHHLHNYHQNHHHHHQHQQQQQQHSQSAPNTNTLNGHPSLYSPVSIRR